MLPHPTYDRLIALGLVGMAKAFEEQRLLRDNLDENGATIWMRRGGRAERQLTMAVVLARL
jgi:hypothetical protein